MEHNQILVANNVRDTITIVRNGPESTPSAEHFGIVVE